MKDSVAMMSTVSETDKSALLIVPLKDNDKTKSNRWKYIVIIVIVVLIIGVLILTLYNRSTTIDRRVTANDIQKLRELLTALYANSTNSFGDSMPLIPTTVRLVFHDCGGPPTKSINSLFDPRYNMNATSICDGCIDLSNTKNHGFLEQGAIKPLEQVYSEHFSNIMSRSDFWVSAGLIALEIASIQRPDRYENIPNLGFWFGRIDCSSSYNTDEGNFSFPSGDVGWSDTYNWFYQQFNLTKRETIALIGAHTLGRAHLNVSGYKNPWIGTDLGTILLNHALFVIILDRSENGNGWKQITVEQSGKKQWVMSNNEQFMLNSDMSLVMKIEEHLDVNSGTVSCSFVDNNIINMSICPEQEETINIVTEYANNNTLWLHEFAKVFQKMTFSGYDVVSDDNFYFVQA